MRTANIILLILCLSAAMLSCQKEIDWGTGTTTTTEQLIRIKSKTGATDSTQIDYSYDGSGRLVRERTTGTGGGIDLGNDLVINRNAAGVITSTVQKSALLATSGVDSVLTRFNYNTSTSKYTSSVFELSVMGFTVSDSAIFTYDANGRITSDAHYLATVGLPLPPMLALRNSYTYSGDGKNMLSVQQEAASGIGGGLSPVSAQVFTYDTKLNPLIILNEAILTARTSLFNGNNASKATMTNTVDPTQDFTQDITYKYNSKDKPDSSYSTRTPGGAVTASKYFYQ